MPRCRRRSRRPRGRTRRPRAGAAPPPSWSPRGRPASAAPFSACTRSSSTSMPRTSVPPAMSSSASALPNRPRPMTATESASAMRRDVSAPKIGNLANGGPLFREFVEDAAIAQRERRTEGQRPEPAEEHEQRRGRSSRASGRPAVMPVESPTVANADTTSNSSRSRSRPVMIMSRAGADDHGGDGDEHDRDRLAVHRAREPLAEDVHGALAAQLGHHDEEEHRERRHLDAARGARRDRRR